MTPTADLGKERGQAITFTDLSCVKHWTGCFPRVILLNPQHNLQ